MAAKTQTIGKNITARVEGTRLIIEIDLSKEYGPSSTGKSTIVASSEGNAAIEGTDGGKLGLNFYRPRSR